MCTCAKAMILTRSRCSHIGRPPPKDNGSASRLTPCQAKPPLFPKSTDCVSGFSWAEPCLGLPSSFTGTSLRDSTGNSDLILNPPASDLESHRLVTPAMRAHPVIDISLTSLKFYPLNNITQTTTHERSNLNVRHSRTSSNSTLATS